MRLLKKLWLMLTCECWYPNLKHEWTYHTIRHRSCVRCRKAEFFGVHAYDPGDGHPHGKSWG